MKYEFGVSVYPDQKSLEEIEEYFILARRYGATRVFSSLFSFEGSKNVILDYFTKFIQIAHRQNLKVSLDVNPMCFDYLGANPEDLSVFHLMGVDILRMDLSYGAFFDAKLVRNPYGILIEFNNSVDVVQGLLKQGVAASSFFVCHNFYPQRYTGMKWNAFLEMNNKLKACSKDLKIGAFLSSNAKDTHGVWQAKDGLPTVERLRTLPMDLQARLMLATGNVDTLLIGNAFASERELKALQEVLEEKEICPDSLDPTLKMLVKHGIVDLEKPVKKVRLKLDSGITEKEKEIVFDFYPHLDMGDSSEWIWRTRISRFKYSQPNESIPPRSFASNYFEVGDVVIVNDNYKHYAGEVQIVKIPILNDGTRNRVGFLDANEFLMMELIQDGDIVEFLESRDEDD